jgi:hypothetical protein
VPAQDRVERSIDQSTEEWGSSIAQKDDEDGNKEQGEMKHCLV